MMHRRTLLLAGATLFLTACARTLVEPLSSTRGVEPEKMQKIIREALLRRSSRRVWCYLCPDKSQRQNCCN